MSLDAHILCRRSDFTVDAAVRADAGSVTALFGPSGAGKSTIIQALAGLLPEATGRVALHGRTLMDSDAGVNLPPHRRRIGVVFQDGRLFPHLSVRGNLGYGATRAARSGATPVASFDEVVAMLGIERLLDRRPATLSGGERQRAALGRALLAAPELLLLDEPLSGLDAARRADVLPSFERLRDLARLPIVYVSHSTDEIARLADRVVALDAGRVVADGAVEDVLTRLAFESADTAYEPSSVLTATVAAQDPEHGLTDLALGDATISAAAFPAPIGAEVRLRVRAKDVMIALDEPRRVSATNVLPAIVARCAVTGGAATLELACARQTLIAQITRRAFERLDLAEGAAVYAVVKAVTIAR